RVPAFGLHIPPNTADTSIERYQMTVRGDDVHLVTVDCSAALSCGRCGLALIPPDDVAAAGINRIESIETGDVHHAIYHNRRHFPFFGAADVVHPLCL